MLKPIRKRKEPAAYHDVKPDWREIHARVTNEPDSDYEYSSISQKKGNLSKIPAGVLDKWRDQVAEESLNFDHLSVMGSGTTPRIKFGDVEAGDLSADTGKIVNHGRWHVEDSNDTALDWIASKCCRDIIDGFYKASSIPSVETVMKMAQLMINGNVKDITDKNLFFVDNISFTSALISRLEDIIAKYEHYEKDQSIEKNPKFQIVLSSAHAGSVYYRRKTLQLLHVLLQSFNFLLAKYLKSSDEEFDSLHEDYLKLSGQEIEDIPSAISRFACDLIEMFQKFKVLAARDPVRFVNSVISGWHQKRKILGLETPTEQRSLTKAVLREVEVIIQHYSIQDAMVRHNRRDWIAPTFVPGRHVEDGYLEYTQNNLNTWISIHKALLTSLHKLLT
jgi:hypothetical protein